MVAIKKMKKSRTLFSLDSVYVGAQHMLLFIPALFIHLFLLSLCTPRSETSRRGSSTSTALFFVLRRFLRLKIQDPKFPPSPP